MLPRRHLSPFRRWIGVAAIVLFLFAATILLWPRVREPRHGGKTLSEWLAQGAEEEEGGDLMSGTAEAIESMGPQAIPCLLHWMESVDFLVKLRVVDWLERQSFINLTFQSADARRDMAVAGFAYLGDAAVPAIPELAALIEDSERGEDAVLALTYIGEPAIPVLLKALKNPSAVVRERSVDAIARGPVLYDRTVLNRIIDLTYDADADVRQSAIACLGSCEAQIQVVGKALARVALDKQHCAREYAVSILHEWATNTHLVLPVFRAYLGESNATTRLRTVYGIARMEAEPGIQLLSLCLGDREGEVRAKAFATLGKFTNRVDEATVLLETGDDDSNALVRAAAAGAHNLLAIARGQKVSEYRFDPRDLHSLWLLDNEAAEALGYTNVFLGCGYRGSSYIPGPIVRQRSLALRRKLEADD